MDSYGDDEGDSGDDTDKSQHVKETREYTEGDDNENL